MPTTEQVGNERYWSAYRKYQQASEYADQAQDLIYKHESLKSDAEQSKKNAESLKSKLEKRLRQVEEIIKLLDGGKVSRKLEIANEKAQKADNKFSEAIHTSGITVSPNLAVAYGTQTVQDNSDTNSALSNVRLEKQSLEARILEQVNIIRNAEQTIKDENASIRDYEGQQAYYKKEMRNAESEMYIYRRYR